MIFFKETLLSIYQKIKKKDTPHVTMTVQVEQLEYWDKKGVCNPPQKKHAQQQQKTNWLSTCKN